MTNKQLMDIPAPNSASKPRLKVTKSVPILPPTSARRVELQTNISNRTALPPQPVVSNESAQFQLPMNNDFGPEPEPYLEPVQIRTLAKKQPPSASDTKKASPAESKKTLTWCSVTVPPPRIVLKSQKQRERQASVESKQHHRDREENLAYLVVDLKTGKPSFEATSFDDLETVPQRGTSVRTLPTRSLTMSSIKKKPKPAPKPKPTAKDSLKEPASSESAAHPTTPGDHRSNDQHPRRSKRGELSPSKPKPVVARPALTKLPSMPPAYGGLRREERPSLPSVMSDSALVKRWTTVGEVETSPGSTRSQLRSSQEGARRHSFKVQSRRLEDSLGKDSVSSRDSTSSREPSPCSDSFSSKQLLKRVVPTRPPPPSAEVLSRAKNLKSKSPISTRHMSISRKSNGSYYEDVDSLIGEETTAKYKTHFRSKCPSSSSVSSGVVSPSSLSETDKLTYPNDSNIYQEIDSGFPIPPPRKKKQSKNNKKSPNLQTRKLQKSDIGAPEPVECYSAPLTRKSLVTTTSPAPTMTPPPIPPKSTGQSSNSKFRQPDVESKLSFSEEDEVYIDPSAFSKLGGSEEPDIGGTDEYVDMHSLNAWNPDSGGGGGDHKDRTTATAAELASDKAEDMYVEMHPAVANSLDDEEEEEEEEEPVYIEMDPTVYIPPPSPPASVHYASKDMLAKRPDLQHKHTKVQRKGSSK